MQRTEEQKAATATARAERLREAAVKAGLQLEANRVQRQLAHNNADRRALASKARAQRDEAFTIIGRIQKSHSISVVVGVSHWRGVTTLELHEYERTILSSRPSGHCMFLDIKHLPELIGLLEQA